MTRERLIDGKLSSSQLRRLFDVPDKCSRLFLHFTAICAQAAAVCVLICLIPILQRCT